jgi:hypothetical protein
MVENLIHKLAVNSWFIRDTHYPLKLALTSPTSGGRSVGIVCLLTKATEIFFLLVYSNRTLIISDFTGFLASKLSELNRVNIFQISCLF